MTTDTKTQLLSWREAFEKWWKERPLPLMYPLYAASAAGFAAGWKAAWNARPTPSGHADTKAIREALEHYQYADDVAVKLVKGFHARKEDIAHNSPARKALAALSRLESSHGVGEDWQPIETAPDDALLLVYMADGGITIAAHAESLRGNRYWYENAKGSPMRGKVTHWMLIPKPPQADIAAYEESKNG